MPLRAPVPLCPCVLLRAPHPCVALCLLMPGKQRRGDSLTEKSKGKTPHLHPGYAYVETTTFVRVTHA